MEPNPYRSPSTPGEPPQQRRWLTLEEWTVITLIVLIVTSYISGIFSPGPVWEPPLHEVIGGLFCLSAIASLILIVACIVKFRRGGAACLLLACCSGLVFADEDLKNAKPVPRLQVLPLPNDEASVTDDGLEFTRYHFGNNLRRPFLYPLIGPSGRSVTRMGHPRDPNSHSHHNSVWISHNNVGGVDFWSDRGMNVGQIVHQRVVRYEDAADEASIQVVNAWKDPSGKVLLDELRTMRFRRQANGEWLGILDLELSAKTAAVTLGKTPFGLVGVRMAKTIGVNDGGGRILNSAGGHDEAEVFWKPAKWVDYAGPISKDKREGVTLFDHPSNPNHPSVFHVRNDGWMGASLTFDGERSIEPAKPLKLRYGLWVHSGVLEQAAIEKEYTAFEKVGDPPAVEKK